MPNVQDIVTLARQKAYVSASQYTDADAIVDFNIVYHKFENDLVRYVDDNYYYDVQYTDLIPNQTEYVIPLSTSTISGFKKVKRLSVKYQNDGYNVYGYNAVLKQVTLTVAYSGLAVGQTVNFVTKEGYSFGSDTVFSIQTPGLEFTLTNGITGLNSNYMLQTVTGVQYQTAVDVTMNNQDMDENRYRNNQPQYQPWYQVADMSLWIYPISTQYVANGLKIYTIRDQVDLAITDVESAINIPRQHQNLIADGMVPRIYQRRGMIQEKNDAVTEFDNLMEDAIKELAARSFSPIEGTMPPLRYLE